MLRIFDFTVDLRERLFTRHGEDRVPEGYEETNKPPERPSIGRDNVVRLICWFGRRRLRLVCLRAESVRCELRHPAQSVPAEHEIVRHGFGRKPLLVRLRENGQPAPEDHEDNHDGRHVHDPERIVR